MTTVAALYVDPKGIYSEFPDVECWGLPERDARNYEGPHPVVAHPPCQRWGRYWSGGPNPAARRYDRPGDDGGCFLAAFRELIHCGGVLEHPEASHAWARFQIPRPPRKGCWLLVPPEQGDRFALWTCCVEQGHYGHFARKATWLLAALPKGVAPPQLMWGPSSPGHRLEPGYHSAEEARAARSRPDYKPAKRPSQKQNEATPRPFAELLVRIARSARVQRGAR